MMQEYDIKYLSAFMHEKKPELWRRIGWMLSDLNTMAEKEDKDRMVMLATEAIVFMRENNLKVSTRDEVSVFRKIAEVSRIEQGLKRRT